MLSNLSFRPRPIDVNRALPIIRDLPELDEREYTSGGGRSVPQMPTGMEAEEEEEAHIQEAIKRSLKVFSESNEKAIEIPTPTVIIVDGYDTEDVAGYNRPQTYVKWKDPTNDELDQTVEYDLEPEDEEFLAQLNAQKQVLTDAKLEWLIDRLEKESDHHNSEIPPLSSILEKNFGVRPNIMTAVYNHWAQRRRDANMPLIYRLLRPPEPEDPSPYHAFRPRNDDKMKRKARKNDQPSLVKMRQLRQEMERARTILEMVKKRERHKKELVEFMEATFDLQCLEARLMPGTVEKEIDERQVKRRKKNRNLEELDSSEEDSEVSDSDISLSDEDTPPPSPRRPPVSLQGLTSFPFLSHRGLATINLGPKIPPFRGRARIGRGGRVILDRRPPVIKSQGIVRYFETDEECNPRIHSLSAMYKSGHHPANAGTSDAEKLLKQFTALNAHLLGGAPTTQKKKRKSALQSSGNSLLIDFDED